MQLFTIYTTLYLQLSSNFFLSTSRPIQSFEDVLVFLGVLMKFPKRTNFKDHISLESSSSVEQSSINIVFIFIKCVSSDQTLLDLYSV